MGNLNNKAYQQFSVDEETRVMQEKIFHWICGVILLTIPATLAISFITEVSYISSIAFLRFFLIAALFYNSKVLGNLRTSVIIFTIILHAGFIASFISNGGLDGTALISFMVSLIFTIAVMPVRQYPFWVSLNVLVAVALICLQYLHPEWVKNGYHSRLGLYTHIVFAYVVGVACITIILTYILLNYKRERKKAIVALKDLANANESKTKLLSILSHDLKAPLNSIQGFLELLLQYDLDDEEDRAIKHKLLKETKDTQSMLANILFWTKSQMEGSIQTNLLPLNLQEVLSVPIALQQAAATIKQIRIVSEIDSSLYVLADEEMIKLVVRNLLNNAVKFTRPGGEIKINANCIDGPVILTIADNGIGISEEKQQLLFSLNSGTTYGTGNETGIGLGLKLCKEFIELQGGRISFTSSPNKGTEFIITLPMAECV